jgi:hypothetical protein
MNTKQMARAPLNRSTSRRALAAAFAACLSVGCGGGSGGNDAVALGTVVVTVVDALGAPVAGASVTVNSQTPHGRAAEFAGAQGFADARGVASVEVAPGNVWAEAYDESIGYFGDTPREPGIVLPPNGSVDITVTVHPSANPSLGIAPAAVSADAIADDGRSFEFTLKAIAIGAEDGWDLTLADCVPDTNNDSPSTRLIASGASPNSMRPTARRKEATRLPSRGLRAAHRPNSLPRFCLIRAAPSLRTTHGTRASPTPNTSFNTSGPPIVSCWLLSHPTTPRRAI